MKPRAIGGAQLRSSGEQRYEGCAIDRYLEVYDVRTYHEIEVAATPEATYRAARVLDLGSSAPVAVLFAIRTVPNVLTGKVRPSRSLTLETLLEAGVTILEDSPPREIVIGVVGKFWRPDSGLVRITPDEFRGFDEPGYAKGVFTFVVEEDGSGSWLATETRVACTDSSARRMFSLYWSAIRPFSGLIRRMMLREIKRSAEKT